MRTLALLALLGCAAETGPPASGDAPVTGDAGAVVDVPGVDVPEVDTPPAPITVVTFNTGSGPDKNHDAEPDDGYGSAQAALTDQWYGNGLAWKPLIADAAAFFAANPADIVGFQEIFWSGECPNVPEDARAGFVCEDWLPGDPTVAETVLGAGFEVACHPGKPDKCLAVRRAFGRLLGDLTGYPIDGCGGGARVARGVVEPADGSGPITVVSVHGSSGFDEQSFDCRDRQARAALDAADGERNIILGDFNTDPGKLADSEPAAARWAGAGLRFHTEIGFDVTPTYGGLFNIDHVLSDAFDGGCWAAGVTPGHPAVSDIVFFDHVPIVCTLEAR